MMAAAKGDTERALAESAARDAFRVQLADAFSGLSDPEALLDTACRLLGKFMGVDRALYGRIENDDYVVEQEYCNGVSSHIGRLRAGDFGHELVQLTLEGKRVVCDDVRTDPRIAAQLAEAYDGVQVRAFISVPLIRNEQRIGTVVVSCATPRRWTQHEIELVAETGDRTWYAVERAHAEREVQRAAAADAYRIGLADALRGTDPCAIRAIVCRRLTEHLGASRTNYVRVEAGDYVVEHDFCDGCPSTVGRYPVMRFGAALRDVLLAGQAIVTDDVSTDPRFPPEVREAMRALQIGAFVSVPLIKNGEWVGGTGVHSITPRRWRQDEIDLIVETTERAWSAIDRAAAELELQRAAARDGYRIQLADALRGLTDPDAIREVACRRLTEHLRANRATYVRLDEGDYVVESDYCDGCASAIGRYPRVRFGQAIQDLLFAGEVAFSDDVLVDPRFTPGARDTLLAFDVRSFISVPLIKNGEWVGATSLQCKTPRHWQQDEIDVATETTERAWSAIQRAQAELELQRAAVRDAYRIKLADALRSARDVPAINEAATRVFGELVGANRVMWMWIEGDHLMIEPEYCKGLPSLAGRHPLASISAHARDVLNAGGALVVHDMTTTPWLSDANRAAYVAGGVVAMMSIGLVRNGAWVAGFAVNCSTPRVWTDDEQTLMRETVDRTWAEIERARAEDALRASEAAFREADRRKDEFIAMLAHELRNPLSPLRTATEVLRLGSGKPEILEEMRLIIERQVEHMTHLVDDLLDAARITRGTIVLRRAPASLEQIVDAAVEAHRQAISTGRLELMVSVPSIDATIDVDATRLVQVISNILHNAVKFTPPGGRIQLSGDVRDGALMLTVTDSGDGIAADELPFIFDLFRRGTASGDRHHSGLGVGLALVRTIVELHGGQVCARSGGPGRGAEIAIRVPSASVENAPAPRRPTPIGLSRMRTVLIVDDNADAARSIELLVQTLGGIVEIAPDGSAGLSRARELKPDIVLLDIGMPGLDGYETCRRMRQEHGNTIKIVALTGWGKEEDKRRAMEAGFDEHMTKPADPVRIRELLQRR
jgi:GAF domain-containing protein